MIYYNLFQSSIPIHPLSYPLYSMMTPHTVHSQSFLWEVLCLIDLSNNVFALWEETTVPGETQTLMWIQTDISFSHQFLSFV